MNSLLFAFNAVAPIILMVAIGYILKKTGFMNADFSKKANKLVFRVFLPVKLFLNIYGINSTSSLNLDYVIYALVSLICIFLLAIPAVILITKKKKSRGALLQGIFRSNYALIGIPLAAELFGAEGEAVATLLSAFLVPTFNILAVIGLSIFNNEGKKPNFKSILLGIVKNPLIISIVAGLIAFGIRTLLENEGIIIKESDAPAIWKTVGYLADTATPLALLVLGAQFEFSAIPSLKREIIWGVVLRSAIVPLISIGTAYLLCTNNENFGGAQFAALVAAFCTPVAVSSVPMAQEMDADVALAGQLVVWSTIVSGLTLFLSTLSLKMLGVF